VSSPVNTSVLSSAEPGRKTQYCCPFSYLGLQNKSFEKPALPYGHVNGR